MNVWRFILGLFLTAAAGAIDAVSFIRLGAVYASFMSGNTVQIGIHAASFDYTPLLAFLTLVGLFMLGSFIGAVVMAKTGSWHLTLILAMEFVAVGVALTLDLTHGLPLATTAPLSFAMGAQNHLVVLARGANPATTFVTGTAFRFADAVAQRVLGRDPTGAWKLHLAVWASFAAGAGAGTIAQLRLHEYALAPILALVATLTVAAFGTRIARPPAPAS
jgi:uncharacterized membrane protein YoaK (UPF0700 family)